MNKNIFTRKTAVFLAVLFLSLLVHVSAGGSDETHLSLWSVQQEEGASKAMSQEAEEADIPESMDPAAEQEIDAGDSSPGTETSSAYEDPHEGQTEPRSTESQSTDSQSTDSQSTDAQSTESQSTDSQSTDSQSKDSQSTDSQSTDSQSKDSQNTKSQTTESQATSTGESQLQETKKTYEEPQTDVLSEESTSNGEMDGEMDGELDDGMASETTTEKASEMASETETEDNSETLSGCTCDSIEENVLAHSWNCGAFQKQFLKACDCIFPRRNHGIFRLRLR